MGRNAWAKAQARQRREGELAKLVAVARSATFPQRVQLAFNVAHVALRLWPDDPCDS